MCLQRDWTLRKQTILPRFFKHSKFPSFVRQLNFYSFRKLRPPADTRISSAKCVRFTHEYFRRGKPELLHRIQRITKSQDVCSNEVRSLRDDIAEVSDEICSFSTKMEQRFRGMKATLELDYQQRMTSVAFSYQLLSTIALQLASAAPSQPPHVPLIARSQSPPTAPSPPPTSVLKSIHIDKPTSPTSVSGISPLMALSMVAAMDREQEFNCT